MNTTIYKFDNYTELLKYLPKDLEAIARDTGAMKRKLKSFKDIESALRLMLIHIGKGISLRESSALSKSSGLGNISDVGLLEMIQKFEGFFYELCCILFKEINFYPQTELSNKGIKLRIIDGTVVKEPGKTGSQWLLHYSFDLCSLACDYFKLTPSSGKGNGENLNKYEINPGDCIIADRCYSRYSDISYVKSQGGEIVLRLSSKKFIFYNNDNIEINLLDKLQSLKEGEVGEYDILLSNKVGTPIAGRVCAILKSKSSYQKTLSRMKEVAQRKQFTNSVIALEYAKYVIIFTTLDKNIYSKHEILEIYRSRWQIEIAFKRLKSLTNIGHIPKYSDKSTRAWIYGKMLISLLTEKIIRLAETISPWGNLLHQEGLFKMEGI